MSCKKLTKLRGIAIQAIQAKIGKVTQLILTKDERYALLLNVINNNGRDIYIYFRC